MKHEAASRSLAGLPSRRRSALGGAVSPVEVARYAFGRATEQICARLGVSAVFHTPVGVKAINPIFESRLWLDAAYERAPRNVALDQLRLGLDALNDSWTLGDTGLVDSPHVSLMEAFLAGTPLASTSYVERLRCGTLDWRRPRLVSRGFLSYMQRRFNEQRHALRVGLAPLFGSSTERSTYILDGKHRAALAVVLGKPIRCEEVPNSFHDSYFGLLRRRMAERPGEYTVQLRLLEEWEA